MTLLEIDDLHVSFATEEGVVSAVDGVSLELAAGEVLAIVGESGSGKSVTVMTVMGLTRARNARISGSVRLDGRELLSASDRELRRIRGEQVAMVFQDPMTAFDPVQRIGDQIVEQIRAHERDVSAAAARERAIELMERAGIPRAPAAGAHRDRCWLTPPDKRRLRVVDGQIGLATPETVIA